MDYVILGPTRGFVGHVCCLVHKAYFYFSFGLSNGRFESRVCIIARNDLAGDGRLCGMDGNWKFVRGPDFNSRFSMPHF